MRELRQKLDQQLRDLKAEQELIGQAITDIQRRQKVFEEKPGWNLVDEEAKAAQKLKNPSGEPEWAMSIAEKAWRI